MRNFLRRIWHWLTSLGNPKLPSAPEFEFAEISAIVTQLCIDAMPTKSTISTGLALAECRKARKPATPLQIEACFRKLALVSQSFRDVIPQQYVPANFVQPNRFKVTPRMVRMTPAQIQARNKVLRDKWELARPKQTNTLGVAIAGKIEDS